MINVQENEQESMCLLVIIHEESDERRGTWELMSTQTE
jgi:hypothetical protein